MLIRGHSILRPALLALALWTAGAGTRAMAQVEHYLCGAIGPFVAVAELQGLTSAGVACSPVTAYGIGAWRDGVVVGGSPGPLTVGLLSIEKARDANSIALRRAAFLGQSSGILRLVTVQRSGPGGSPLLESEIRLDQAAVVLVRTNTVDGRGSEVIEISGRRYAFNSWSPAAPPGSTPTVSYCRDLADGGSTCPAPL